MNNTFSLTIGENFPFPRKSGGGGIKLEAHPLGIFLCIYFSNPADYEHLGFSYKKSAETKLFDFKED